MATYNTHDGNEVFDSDNQVQEIERLSTDERVRAISRFYLNVVLQHDFEEQKKKSWSHPEFKHL